MRRHCPNQYNSIYTSNPFENLTKTQVENLGANKINIIYYLYNKMTGTVRLFRIPPPHIPIYCEISVGESLRP